ncbi:GtrA family protein [Mucilaginibacter auburnensis]|uniref:GtrA-like protein n=1 Tax=Mucilaginibacter auburnensis TaxID=1457233 RepID=A0A2H9VVI9_9SPHI|nr:GtrA family protein [Mucilaginibacter auburnensis]PJJ84853.1 GtrA-like protein [Mucilaginibacter auburnensis]
MGSAVTANKFFKNQVVRFILSAGAGFVVDICAFYLLYHNFFERPFYSVFGYALNNYKLSLGVSFFMGVIVNFLITRYFVFNKSASTPLKQFIRFSAVAVVGFFANLALLDFFVQTLDMYPPVARITAALSLFFTSFFVHKIFSFSLSLRHHAGEDNSTSN